jgi:hypothetical protein
MIFSVDLFALALGILLIDRLLFAYRQIDS